MGASNVFDIKISLFPEPEDAKTVLKIRSTNIYTEHLHKDLKTTSVKISKLRIDFSIFD